MTQTEFRVEYQFQQGEVRVLLEGIEVMRVLFDSASYGNALFSKLKESDSFISVSEEEQHQARERLAKKGVRTSDKRFKNAMKRVTRELELKIVRDSIEPAVKNADENLLNVVRLIWENLVIQATAFAGANALRDKLNAQEQRYSAKDIKKGLLDPVYDLIKPLAGIKHGGERERKQSAFTWDKDKAREFFKTVQALPQISKEPLWDYAAEQLRENDYAAEIVTWLQSNPAFIDSPEPLLKEAARVWRTFVEEGKNIPAASKPLAFAFRHACYKLGYLAGKYNTLRTRYYEGKKAQELIDKP
jgi:hypothetical protein